MRGLLVDVNIQGHSEILRLILGSPEWQDFLDYLQLSIKTFKEVGLAVEAPDAVVWRLCQSEDFILLTANRNKDGPDSLEATIANENKPDSLPVMTLASPEQVRHSKSYAAAVVERMLEYLLGIDKFRGTGRLYLP